MNQEISKIHTCCKNCVFSVYSGITQELCALNYIDTYRKKGVDIIEAYDNEKEFFLINDKKCIGYRENKWFKQFNLDNATLEEKIGKYLESNQLNYSLVLDLKKINKSELDQILLSVKSLSVTPEKIIFIRYVNDQQNFPYEYIQELLNKHELTNLPWRIQTTIESDTDYLEILHNITMNNTKSRFIVSITNKTDGLKDLIEKANTIVHKDLDQFIVLKNQDNTCLVYSVSVYRYEWFINSTNLLKKAGEHIVI
jgi:hypothetical protein